MTVRPGLGIQLGLQAIGPELVVPGRIRYSIGATIKSDYALVMLSGHHIGSPDLVPGAV